MLRTVTNDRIHEASGLCRCVVFFFGAAIALQLSACLDSGSGSTDRAEVDSPGAPEAGADVPTELLPDVPVWTGDFDGMVERRMVRALVSYSKTHFFLDGGQPRGLSYESLSEFEAFINRELGTRSLRVNVMIVPVRRDELLPALAAGRGDVAVANLTATEERLRLVDFSSPLLRDVSEVVVTGPDSPSPKSVEDLARIEIHVRRSSSYYVSLQRLSEGLLSNGRDALNIVDADEFLEDEDLLEMVSAGLIPATVVDSHKAEFWATVYPGLKVRPDLAVSSGGSIAWAIRKDTPQLREVVNDYVRGHRKGTLFGNIVFKRYLEDSGRLASARSEQEVARLVDMLTYFQVYGRRYGHDWRLLAAQGYQESRLDQSRRSRAGAVGVMQIRPSTAADKNVAIKGIDQLENNIHAGAKYLGFLRDRYFSEPGVDSLDRELLALAAYNAGPARINRLRRQTAAEGLDPNRWFRNVELAAARDIGRETVQYVSNVYKYFIAYRELSRWPQVQEALQRMETD